jgi:hypothetical protein
MARNFVWLPCLAFLILLGAMTVSCSSSGSGGNSSGSGGNTGPFNVVGNWQAVFSANVGANLYGYGVIDSSGLSAFFDASGNIVQLPTITGTKSFSGSLTAYAVNGTFFPGGAVMVTDSAQGTVNSATSITGAFTGSPSGDFAVTGFSPLSGSVVPPSGTMQGEITGFADTLELTFTSGGAFTGADFAGPGSTCNLIGTLTQEGTSNVFDVIYNSASGDCYLNSQTGVAFESTTDYFNVNGGADSSYLYMILLTSKLTQVRPSVMVIYQ